MVPIDDIDATEAYRDTRLRITGLARGADPGRAVRACPEWSVHDLLAHVVGVVDDILAGRMDGVASEEWTSAQVGRGAGLSMDELLDRWAETGPQIEGGGALPDQLLFDAVTHEHDLRAAVDQPGARRSLALGAAARFVLAAWGARLDGDGLPAVAVRIEDEDRIAGTRPPALSLATDRFDLVRSLSGRRTEEQTRALEWSDDPSRWLASMEFGPFRRPREPVDPVGA